MLYPYVMFINTPPKEGVYTFNSSDRIIEFALENKLLVRGHTLIWHTQVPDWFFEDIYGKQASRELLLERMKTHIYNVVSKFKNRINCWDVVNEAIDDIFYRDTKWHSIIGDDYIDKAFHFAHESDPNALLFCNDYNDAIKIKRDKIYKLIKELKDRDVPIHGIGLQGHYGLYFPELSEIMKSIKMFSKLDFKIQITEMDISVFNWEDRRID